MAMPTYVKYLIIGAGIHGLSTAWHLAENLKAKGKGSGEDILIVDKTAIAAGASGIACGVVRNNYYQPAMRELMAQCVEVWESDPKAFSYHPVGYLQISPEAMRADVATIHAQQRAIDYDSVFVEGAAESMAYMKGIFDDWQARGITSVLHEKRGGYANNTASMYGLATKAENLGVRILTGVKVTGFQYGHNSDAVTAVETDRGVIECEQVVVGVGPWVNQVWNMLELPKTVSIKDARGEMHHDIPMWTYLALEEGTLGVDPNFLKT
ncbi:MAG: FAD-dependent oxidoreductase, partial [Kiloniellales bacterium]